MNFIDPTAPHRRSIREACLDRFVRWRTDDGQALRMQEAAAGSQAHDPTEPKRAAEVAVAEIASLSRAGASAIEPRSVLAIVGLLFEARIAAGPGVVVVCREAGRSLARSLENARKEGYRSIISFGVAGGLCPDLRPGDWIVASSIVSAKASYATDLPLSRKLLQAVPGAEYAPIAGVDRPVLDALAKRDFHRRVGAVAVDMESHLVAEFAITNGLAFAAVRVVIDPAHRSVPASALAGLRPDGGTQAGTVLRELLRSPRDVPQLARLVVDALAARSALVRTRRSLGPGFGLLEPAHEEPASLPSLGGTA